MTDDAKLDYVNMKIQSRIVSIDGQKLNFINSGFYRYLYSQNVLDKNIILSGKKNIEFGSQSIRGNIEG